MTGGETTGSAHQNPYRHAATHDTGWGGDYRVVGGDHAKRNWIKCLEAGLGRGERSLIDRQKSKMVKKKQPSGDQGRRVIAGSVGRETGLSVRNLDSGGDAGV